MTIAVEKDIPVPTVRARVSKYPYASLEINDSFVIENGNLQHVCNLNYITGKKLNKKFICRTEGSNVRVWRKQ